MNEEQKARLSKVKEQMTDFLCSSAEFWLSKSFNPTVPGYMVCFDEKGNPATTSEVLKPTDRMIVTQSRMVWGFSALLRTGLAARCGIDENRCQSAAMHGASFLSDKIFDSTNGGFAWYTNKQGSIEDNGKLVYGQSFGIYAAAEYFLATNESILFRKAMSCFERLQMYCIDSRRGGYYENLDEKWRLETDRDCGGDLKSLDIHMHILEAYTTLYEALNKLLEPDATTLLNCRRLLMEVIEIILEHMIDYEYGCGRNQFDFSFRPKPAWAIHRTWNYDRDPVHANDNPLDTTSFGHNIELTWLLNRAYKVLGLPPAAALTKKLVDQALAIGWDYTNAGFYRDGLHNGQITNTDKEWWQNFEALTGLFDAYQVLGDDTYLDKFFQLWDFDFQYFYNPAVGESRRLLKADGSCIDGTIGNQWKCTYHTQRAMMECLLRFDQYI